MIEPDEMMDLLLAACPSFATQWEESLVDKGPDEATGNRLHYGDAADLVRHVVSLQIDGRTSELDAVFDTIERLLAEGDPYVQNLATIGYIEGFQMAIVADLGADPERDIRPWLRSMSEIEWQRLNELWGGPATSIHPTDGRI